MRETSNLRDCFRTRFVQFRMCLFGGQRRGLDTKLQAKAKIQESEEATKLAHAARVLESMAVTDHLE